MPYPKGTAIGSTLKSCDEEKNERLGYPRGLVMSYRIVSKTDGGRFIGLVENVSSPCFVELNPDAPWR